MQGLNLLKCISSLAQEYAQFVWMVSKIHSYKHWCISAIDGWEFYHNNLPPANRKKPFFSVFSLSKIHINGHIGVSCRALKQMLGLFNPTMTEQLCFIIQQMILVINLLDCGKSSYAYISFNACLECLNSYWVFLTDSLIIKKEERLWFEVECNLYGWCPISCLQLPILISE